MKKFEEPIFEIERFAVEDVITASGADTFSIGEDETGLTNRQVP